MSRALAACLALAFALGAAPTASGDEVASEGASDRDVGGRIGARVSFDVAPSLELGGGRGELRRVRERLEVRFERRLDVRFTWRLETELEAASYRLSDPDRLAPGPGRLLDEALRVRVQPGLDASIADGWSVTAQLGAEVAGAPDADALDALRLGGSLTVRRRLSSEFGLRAGAVVVGRLEEAPFVVPFVAPDGGDGPSRGPLRFEVRGTGARLGYALSPALVVGVFGGYERRDWRLSRRDRVPEGVLRDVRVPVGLFVDHRTASGLTFGLEAGITAYAEIVVTDRDGRRIGGADAPPAPFVGVSLSLDL